MKLRKQALSLQSSAFLNLVRLVACELVVLGHFLTKYQPTPYDALFRMGSTIGGAAVLAFFVLSGFLITYSLLNKADNPKYGFRSYFVDRFSRIYSGLIPALVLAGALAAVIYTTNYTYYTQLCSMQSAPSLQTLSMTALMLERFPVGFFQTLLAGTGISFPLPDVTPFGFNGILWTLVVEWWIYMFFGWLVIGGLAFWGKRQKSGGCKAAIAAGVGVLCLVLAGLFVQYTGAVVTWFLGVLVLLCVGSETIRMRLAGDSAKRLLAAVFAFSLAVLAFALYATFAWTRDYYGVALGLAISVCILLGVLLLNHDTQKPVFNKRTAGYIALGAGFSYTLFLTHYPIIIYLNGLDLPVNRFLMLIPILLITNFAAYAIAYFTEKRHKQLAVAIKKAIHLPVPVP
ncbi:MAG: acyltransferase family protein [Candidatus Bathyarchaeia archaeon]